MRDVLGPVTDEDGSRVGAKIGVELSRSFPFAGSGAFAEPA
jgi:hypothetical protein